MTGNDSFPRINDGSPDYLTEVYREQRAWAGQQMRVWDDAPDPGPVALTPLIRPMPPMTPQEVWENDTDSYRAVPEKRLHNLDQRQRFDQQQARIQALQRDVDDLT